MYEHAIVGRLIEPCTNHESDIDPIGKEREWYRLEVPMNLETGIHISSFSYEPGLKHGAVNEYNSGQRIHFQPGSGNPEVYFSLKMRKPVPE